MFFKIKRRIQQRVFENRMLTKILVSKRSDVTGCWKEMYSEDLRNFNCAPSITRIVSYRGIN